MSLLIAHDVGDHSRYAALAERLAKDFSAVEGWDVAEGYWRLVAQWFRLKKEPDEVQTCQLAAAECIVSKAEKGLQVKQLGAGWMGQAVEALRQAKADPGRIKEMHRCFLELERRFVDGIGPEVFDPGKVPDFRKEEKATQEASTAFVRGLSFEEAAMRFAQIAHPTDAAELREQVEDQSKEVIWDKLVASAERTIRRRTGLSPCANAPQTRCKKRALIFARLHEHVRRRGNGGARRAGSPRE